MSNDSTSGITNKVQTAAAKTKEYAVTKYQSPDTKPALAFMFAILAFFALPLIGSILALVLAHWSLKQMDSNKGYGFRLAIIALYLAYSQIALILLIGAMVLFFTLMAIPMFL